MHCFVPVLNVFNLLNSCCSFLYHFFATSLANFEFSKGRSGIGSLCLKDMKLDKCLD